MKLRPNMYAILEGKTVVGVDDVLEWGKFFEGKSRVVGKTKVGKASISTVFLGLNHSWEPDEKPLWFETMIFGGPLDQWQERYTTWDEAEAGHKKLVRLAKLVRFVQSVKLAQTIEKVLYGTS